MHNTNIYLQEEVVKSSSMCEIMSSVNNIEQRAVCMWLCVFTVLQAVNFLLLHFSQGLSFLLCMCRWSAAGSERRWHCSRWAGVWAGGSSAPRRAHQDWRQHTHQYDQWWDDGHMHNKHVSKTGKQSGRQRFKNEQKNNNKLRSSAKEQLDSDSVICC